VRTPPYTVVWPEAVATALVRLRHRQPDVSERLVEAVERYAATGVGDVLKLQGRAGYRLRVGGWRVLFELDHAQRRLLVLAVARRKDIYRR
jgi:mRNA interferase RelE/StbE